ncbi:hypothetical protein PBI_DRMANHATTAN_67 [Arthrobacter phage DrManhattan]|uniref:Uncharacterized protein n=1 Tax=Arthrobacter phage DrManhattan TaxID=2419955 RepID=A0A3G2KFS2_9CAUD|nr:hypothetical protein HOU48_gp67 [Arthrobacter phage DrManhattan]AYN57785.1 hypothetical protein PBI_DRMANHATTAN_67 [Arthrobacter phage DrManhattan]
MMNRSQILAAQAEARRFVQAADVALARLDEEIRWRDDRYDSQAKHGYDGPRPAPGAGPDDYSYGSAATGTLRRRSMDLTRALADLRRPRPWN